MPRTKKRLTQRTVLHEVPSGQIAIETSGGEAFLRFDCDCLDALPYCHARCCGLAGLEVTDEEMDIISDHLNSANDPPEFPGDNGPYPFKEDDGQWELARMSDGMCIFNCRESGHCNIYDHRPETCRAFHCTRNADNRGWRLDFSRQPTHE